MDLDDEFEAHELSAAELEEEWEPDPDAERDRLIDDGWTNAEIFHRETHDIFGRYLGPKDEVKVEPDLFVVDGAAVYDTKTDSLLAIGSDEFWHKVLDVSDGGGG